MGLSFYIFFLSQHATTITPGPLQVHIPITSLQTMAFSQPVRDRRVMSPEGDDIPAIRLSQLKLPDPSITGLQCSLNAAAC